MASPRNKRKRKRGKGRLGPLFKLLCAGAVAVALTMGATVFFQVETVAVLSLLFPAAGSPVEYMLYELLSGGLILGEALRKDVTRPGKRRFRIRHALFGVDIGGGHRFGEGAILTGQLIGQRFEAALLRH